MSSLSRHHAQAATSRDIQQAEFWASVLRTAEQDDGFRAATQHLVSAIITLGIGPTMQSIELHRGSASLVDGVGCGPVFIQGPVEAWQEFLRDRLPFAQVINVFHGTLSVNADPVVMAWCTPALWALFGAASSVHTGTETA